MESKEMVDIYYYGGYFSVASGPFESEYECLRPKVELGEHPQLTKQRRWAVTVLVQLLSALWLVPIIALLYLNLAGHVIGPTAWCPGGGCHVDTWNPNSDIPVQKIISFNKNDHNLLGGLQLVAKAYDLTLDKFWDAARANSRILSASRSGSLPSARRSCIL